MIDLAAKRRKLSAHTELQIKEQASALEICEDTKDSK
jgi:hypothetical protein